MTYPAQPAYRQAIDQLYGDKPEPVRALIAQAYTASGFDGVWVRHRTELISADTSTTCVETQIVGDDILRMKARDFHALFVPCALRGWELRHNLRAHINKLAVHIKDDAEAFTLYQQLRAKFEGPAS